MDWKRQNYQDLFGNMPNVTENFIKPPLSILEALTVCNKEIYGLQKNSTKAINLYGTKMK